MDHLIQRFTRAGRSGYVQVLDGWFWSFVAVAGIVALFAMSLACVSVEVGGNGGGPTPMSETRVTRLSLIGDLLPRSAPFVAGALAVTAIALVMRWRGPRRWGYALVLVIGLAGLIAATVWQHEFAPYPVPRSRVVGFCEKLGPSVTRYCDSWLLEPAIRGAERRAFFLTPDHVYVVRPLLGLWILIPTAFLFVVWSAFRALRLWLEPAPAALLLGGGTFALYFALLLTSLGPENT